MCHFKERKVGEDEMNERRAAQAEAQGEEDTYDDLEEVPAKPSRASFGAVATPLAVPGSFPAAFTARHRDGDEDEQEEEQVVARPPPPRGVAGAGAVATPFASMAASRPKQPVPEPEPEELYEVRSDLCRNHMHSCWYRPPHRRTASSVDCD